MQTLIEDSREILAIHDDTAAITWHVVGVNGVEKIEPYKEIYGESFVPYLAVFINGELAERRPAIGLRIQYKSQ